MTTAELLARLGIILVADLLLSGDNAVVIALVCRDLPGRLRAAGMVLGTAGAVVMRLVMAAFATTLIALPGLRVVGGLLLLWVAYNLVRNDDGGEGEPQAATTLWRAVWLIALADASMSLDNVIALAALAHGSWLLMVLGVVVAIPIVVAGAKLISLVVERLPLLVWAGAALLGWVAGGIVMSDPWLAPELGADIDQWTLVGEISGAASVVLLALAANSLDGNDE